MSAFEVQADFVAVRAHDGIGFVDPVDEFLASKGCLGRDFHCKERQLNAFSDQGFRKAIFWANQIRNAFRCLRISLLFRHPYPVGMRRNASGNCLQGCFFNVTTINCQIGRLLHFY